VETYQCPICHQQDPHFIGMRQGQPYCRACIRFQYPAWVPKPRIPLAVRVQLGYALTPDQLAIAEGLLQCYRQKQSAMVDAVTGSGKTEIVFALIQVALAEGKRIGFVIPRKDVVIELMPRFQQVFPTLKIVMVYGGHDEELEGDLIILTTHQIYRYQSYFDVLIFDEVDAFPYQGDPVLEALVQRSVCGIIVYLSATFSSSTLKKFQQTGGKVFHLYARYHGHPLPLLNLQVFPFVLKWFALLYHLHQFHKKQLPVLVFVPTIAMGHWVYRVCKIAFPFIAFAYANHPERETIIKHFKSRKAPMLIATSILERGITLAGLQVIIFAGDHRLYSASMVIQMAGRVGRKIIAPTGQVIVLTDKVNATLLNAQAKMSFANAHL
jgi:competence protein ComFA